MKISRGIIWIVWKVRDNFFLKEKEDIGSEERSRGVGNVYKRRSCAIGLKPGQQEQNSVSKKKKKKIRGGGPASSTKLKQTTNDRR